MGHKYQAEIPELCQTNKKVHYKRNLETHLEWDPEKVTEEVMASCRFYKKYILTNYKTKLEISDLKNFYKECNYNADNFFFCIVNENSTFKKFSQKFKIGT